MFKDVRFRRAFNYAFDFEEMNKQLFFGNIKDRQLFRGHLILPHRGCRKARS